MKDSLTKENLKKEVGKLIEEAQTKVKDQYKNTKENVSEKREKADKYIKENPEKSILAGAGIGFIAGVIISWLFSRRNRN